MDEVEVPEIARGMQRYRSHKLVWAEKICAAEQTAPDAPWRVALESGRIVEASPKLFARGKPDLDRDGAYLVVYEDGYVAWTPAKPFEDGYTPA